MYIYMYSMYIYIYILCIYIYIYSPSAAITAAVHISQKLHTEYIYINKYISHKINIFISKIRSKQQSL